MQFHSMNHAMNYTDFILFSYHWILAGPVVGRPHLFSKEMKKQRTAATNRTAEPWRSHPYKTCSAWKLIEWLFEIPKGIRFRSEPQVRYEWTLQTQLQWTLHRTVPSEGMWITNTLPATITETKQGAAMHLHVSSRVSTCQFHPMSIFKDATRAPGLTGTRSYERGSSHRYEFGAIGRYERTDSTW